jgi:hypothetical protein
MSNFLKSNFTYIISARDLLLHSRTTIYKNIPDEFKSEEKQRAGRQSHKKVIGSSVPTLEQKFPEIKIGVSSTGEQSFSEVDPDHKSRSYNKWLKVYQELRLLSSD